MTGLKTQTGTGQPAAYLQAYRETKLLTTVNKSRKSRSKAELELGTA